MSACIYNQTGSMYVPDCMFTVLSTFFNTGNGTFAIYSILVNSKIHLFILCTIP